MPSPVGHSLVGFALVLGRSRPGTRVRDSMVWIRRNAGFILLAVFVANLPDLDYLPGVLSGDINATHHLYTHTLGWCLLASACVWLCWRAYDPRVGWATYAFLLALLLSHLVADWLTDDRRAPYGIMAFWPFSSSFFISPVTVFPHLKKLNWAEVFQAYNVKAALVEALICAPVVVVAAVIGGRRRPGGEGDLSAEGPSGKMRT